MDKYRPLSKMSRENNYWPLKPVIKIQKSIFCGYLVRALLQIERIPLARFPGEDIIRNHKILHRAPWRENAVYAVSYGPWNCL
jgi:hypothetical protein